MGQSRDKDSARTARRSEGRSARSAPEEPVRSGDKYQRILDAAIAVIAEKGFHNSRVSDIAERAGVADGTIYLYFPSKERILMAALDSGFEGFLRRARKELEGSASAVDKLRRLARLHLSELGRNREMAVVLQTELRQSSKFLAEFSQREVKRYFDLIREIVVEGQKEGAIRADVSDRIAASCLFGALDELVTAWVLSHREYDLAAAADPVIDLLLSGMEVRG